MAMTSRGNGIGGYGGAGRLLPALALATALLIPAAGSAQMFTDRLGSRCPVGSGDESGAVLRPREPARAIDAADHRAAVNRHRPDGGAAAGRVHRRPGGAVADGALRQGFAGHQQRPGVAGVCGKGRTLSAPPVCSRGAWGATTQLAHSDHVVWLPSRLVPSTMCTRVTMCRDS